MKQIFRAMALAGILAVPLAGPIAAAETETALPPPDTGWDIDYEEDIKRDVAGLVDFMLEQVSPVYGQNWLNPDNPETEEQLASLRLKFEMFQRLLSGCYGEPGLADYALVANHMATLNGSGNEISYIETYGPDSLYQNLIKAYKDSLRWVYDLNAAFFAENPDVRERLSDIQNYNGWEPFSTAHLGVGSVVSQPDMAFGAYSRFMIDPDYAAKIERMNDTPAQDFTARRTELVREGDWLEVNALNDFNPGQTCTVQ